MGTSRTLALDRRGRGESAPVQGDFATAQPFDDAASVIAASRAKTIVPVSIAHARWVAISVRRRFGPDRVRAIVLLDRKVLGAPLPVLSALSAMADPPATRGVVDQVCRMWPPGLELPALSGYVATMVALPDAMWGRAARVIAAAFGGHPTPLDLLAGIEPPTPALPLYAQPADAALFDAQLRCSASHPRIFRKRLDAASHVPRFEVPDAISNCVRAFPSPR